MMVQFQNISNNSFKLNGIPYFKVFIAKAIGTSAVQVICAFDSKIEILSPTKFENVSVNGSKFDSLVDLITSLRNVVFNNDRYSVEGHTHSYNDLTDIPSVFPPDDHTHSYNNLTDLPTTFNPSEHNHDERYLKLSGGTVNGDVAFDGESTFYGTVKFDDEVEFFGGSYHDAESRFGDTAFFEKLSNFEEGLVIDKNKSLSGIANSIFTVKKDSTVPGIDVASFIDVNRNTPTNATSDCYGSVVRLKNASNFDSKGLIAANYVANHVGGGNADYLYGSLFKSAYNGSGNIDFMLPTSHKLEIKGTGVGVIDYARGLSPHVLIDNPNVIVNHAQGLHPTVKFVNGTVKDSHVLYLDVDYDTNGIAKIIGDFAYIQAGNDQLPAVEGTAHFIKSQCKLPSLFSGLIEMDVDAIDIVNGSEKTLVNKEFLTTELSKVNKQIKVYENSRDITSALLNRDRPDAQIGDIVTNKAKPELYQKITETQWVKYQGVLI
ncbi:hypothetical protein [Tenacibaculum sp. 190524A02b]|uniref:hypothetical protein n=1 Tax=Tenacibaculum vairaonense TaxID=3137860 RepID=UPI0031FB8813